MRLRRMGLPALAAAVVVAGALTPHIHQAHAGAPPEDAADWPQFGRGPGAESYSPLAAIDGANVGRLGLAWAHDLEIGNSVTEPVEADGVLYVATRYSVVSALDAVTGRLLWTYDPKTNEVAGIKLRRAWGSRGMAYAHGQVFVGTQDGRLISLDARSGRLLWSVLTTQPGDQRYITGPPRVFGDKVLIGHGGGDATPARGYVTCYDTRTGKQLWRFYTVPGPEPEDEVQAMAATTWFGETWKQGGGAVVWHGISYDPEFNRFYIATGNAEPEGLDVRTEGKGDNLFSASIVALDADSGKYVWHYQLNPGEEWDYDVTGDMVPATLTINGVPRKVLMNAPKNGFFYVLDRTNGKLISAEPFAKVTWATRIDLETGRPVENPAIRYTRTKAAVELWPSLSGAHSWLPMAFSPRTGLVYIPVSDRPYVIGGGQEDIAPARPGGDISYLLAWDPVAQKPVWRVDTPGMWGGGVMATAGGLVFQGQADRRFNAYDAVSGKRVWSYDAASPILAPPITYAVNGVQYVTVVTGWGASAGVYGGANYANQKLDLDYNTMPRRVLTFALDGKVRLPPSPAPTPQAPPRDPDFKADPVQAQRGRVAFRNCLICHGVNAVAAGTAPDLRWSSAPTSSVAFQAIVRDGALLSRGMPRFDDLTPEKVEDIRFFLRTRQHEPH